MYTRGGKREVLQRVELEAENEKLPSGKTTTISQSVSASISPQLKHHSGCCPLQLIIHTVVEVQLLRCIVPQHFTILKQCCTKKAAEC